MKLLIVTQKVDKNDPILGFFHRWLIEFSKNCEKLTVICLFEGKHDLPKNVKVLSLGKENGVSNLKYSLNFWKYIWQERKNYDTVFVHMNPEYFTLAGIFWKLTGKKTALWYTHRSVDLKLKIAEKFTNVIFTVSKESFQLNSKKVKVMGHGIPVEEFLNPKVSKWMSDGILKIVSVGRITPIKNLNTLIEAANILNKKGVDLKVTLVGGTMNESDEKYFEKLKNMIDGFGIKDKIIFAGSMSNEEVKKYYWENNLSVNLAPTGGVDKAVLESMASGMPVLATNEAFRSYFGKYTSDLLFKERDAEDLSGKIFALIKSDKNKIEEIRKYLLDQVKNSSSLSALIKKIVSELK